MRPADFKREWTYDALCAEIEESQLCLELWDGELLMAPAPHAPHQRLVLRLSVALAEFLQKHPVGEMFFAPIDMVLSPRRTTQPDVLFVSKGRAEIVQDAVRGAADLVMEVVSPRGRQRDRQMKRDLYEQHGIAEYWIIDPEASTVEVLALENGEYRLAVRARAGQHAKSVLLRGFSLDVAALFAGF